VPEFWCLIFSFSSSQAILHGDVNKENRFSFEDSWYPEPVAKHLEQEGLEFLQFSFRWLNCLLIREVLDLSLLVWGLSFSYLFHGCIRLLRLFSVATILRMVHLWHSNLKLNYENRL